MKKLSRVIFIGLISVIILTGCVSKGESNLVEAKGLQIVSTVFPGYDFAKEIVGDNAEVSMLLPPGTESHSYEPSPQDIIKIQDADIFIYVGGESEKWVDKVLDSMDENVTVVRMMDFVELYEEEIVEGMQEDNNREDYKDIEHEDEHEYDEHVWTSLRNAQSIVKGINEAVIRVDEDNKDLYDKNTKSYIEKLDNLDKEFENLFKTTGKSTLVFGDRFPFRYFAEDYDLNYFAAFPGCSSETEPSVSTVAFLIDKVKEKSLNTVFYIEFSNHNIADTIAESTGSKTAMLHSCHNISKDDMDNGVSYYLLMEQNYKTLKGALQ